MNFNNVQVAAKTGTAQNGQGLIDAWITGFAPADDPQIAIAVVVHNTTDFGYKTAGPVMKTVLEEAISQ